MHCTSIFMPDSFSREGKIHSVACELAEAMCLRLGLRSIDVKEE